MRVITRLDHWDRLARISVHSRVDWRRDPILRAISIDESDQERFQFDSRRRSTLWVKAAEYDQVDWKTPADSRLDLTFSVELTLHWAMLAIHLLTDSFVNPIPEEPRWASQRFQHQWWKSDSSPVIVDAFVTIAALFDRICPDFARKSLLFPTPPCRHSWKRMLDSVNTTNNSTDGCLQSSDKLLFDNRYRAIAVLHWSIRALWLLESNWTSHWANTGPAWSPPWSSKQENLANTSDDVAHFSTDYSRNEREIIWFWCLYKHSCMEKRERIKRKKRRISTMGHDLRNRTEEDEKKSESNRARKIGQKFIVFERRTNMTKHMYRCVYRRIKYWMNTINLIEREKSTV